MSAARLSKLILEALAEQASQLSEADIQKLEKGTHELSLSLVKKKTTQAGGAGLSETQMVELLSSLQNCESREQGHELVTDALKNKKELEQFAKHLDVLVLKQDKVDQIKEKIIEATVGAILRSNAIQGKNITRP
jgi:hypothetical protein